jgi:putative transposase
MKRKRFTEDRITAVLREHEGGAKTGGLARKNGIAKPRCIPGRQSMAAWTCPTPSG